MKNIDLYKDTVKKIVDDNCKVAIVGEIPVKCNTVSCNICKFTGEKDCQKEMLKWLMKEIKPEILDQKEHEYLEAVIKPFKNQVKFIFINEVCCRRYLEILINENDIMIFPCLRDKKMYKGMSSFKKYTLKELGL